MIKIIMYAMVGGGVTLAAMEYPHEPLKNTDWNDFNTVIIHIAGWPAVASFMLLHEPDILQDD